MKFAYRLLYAVIYGDLFMRLTNAARPYERVKGSTEYLYQRWNQIFKENVHNTNYRVFSKNIKEIIKNFDTLPIRDDVQKPKVGIVGEILVKYHSNANNNIVGIIANKGGEAVVPDLLNFILYTLKNPEFHYANMANLYSKYFFGRLGIGVRYHYRKIVEDSLKNNRRIHTQRPLFVLSAQSGAV